MKYMILLLLLLAIVVNCQDLRSSEEVCAGRETTINCDPNTVIFITNVVNTYADNCNGFKNINDANLNKCESKYMHNLNNYCNGKGSCTFKLQQFDNVIGLHRSTCTFKSNKVNVFYVCVPNSLNTKEKQIDVCRGPSVISTNDVKSGFIHSPNYPSYYGNSRICALSIRSEPNTRINMYLLNMNVESLGIFSRVPKDYLLVTTESTSQQFYGTSRHLIIHNTTETINLRFVSDFITSAILSSPKGFLLYFKASAIVKPTLPPTTIATTQSTTIEYDEEIIEEIIKKDDVLGLGDKEAQVSTPLIADLVESNDIFDNQRYVNDGKNQEDKSKPIYFICLLVALAGLIVIGVTTLLLVIRRRKRQEQTDYSSYNDGKIYVNMKDDGEKKSAIDAGGIANVHKEENIYSPNPLPIETIKNVNSPSTKQETSQKVDNNNDDEIYAVINETDLPSSSSTLSHSCTSSNTNLNDIIDSDDIYSTPTNKELTSDDFNKLHNSVLQSDTTTLDTSTTQLLNNNEQKC